MIAKVEDYCKICNLVINLSKSEIMIFRKGGRVANNERWTLNGEVIRIVSEYKYLGVILTSKMIFSKHVENCNSLAKHIVV